VPLSLRHVKDTFFEVVYVSTRKACMGFLDITKSLLS